MTRATSLLWFRRDLRVKDNPALNAAIAAGGQIIAIYIVDDTRFFSTGAAQRWFLHHALMALGEDLALLGIPLVLEKGSESQFVLGAAKEYRPACVFWNRRYAAEEIEIDKTIREALISTGIKTQSFNGSLLREPWDVKSKSGGPYRVYTPFWTALRAIGPGRVETSPPKAKRAAGKDPGFLDSLAKLELTPTSPNWAAEFDSWRPASTAGAEQALEGFLSSAAATYDTDRNRPDIRGTSRLSPHLALGTIGPVRIWNRIRSAIDASVIPEVEALKYLSEIAWREFAYHLLYHNPSMPTAPLRPEFSAFPWRGDDDAFKAWKTGRTGIPIVDAGMRELWRTGWMHNRVRMIAASFLVKNLLIPWQKGERWFWDTLVDADPANNPSGWQWVAGCGADAAPYFRIFNPVTQGEKFDPDGAYVRRFVPEIAALPNNFIHAPWKAPAIAASLDYPPPIIDPGQSRNRALAAYHEMKNASIALDAEAIDA